MSNPSQHQLLAMLPEWDRFLTGYKPPAILAADEEISEIKMRVVNLRRRLRDGPLAPLRIAFFGPTGSGKSKLFSSLVGKNVSGSGYRRPFTRRANYYLHDDWHSLTPTLLGDVDHHTDDTWRDAILIDTPDFDSVEESNRAEAERVYLEADGFLFVTDALKYADASTWDYLGRIRSSGKQFCTILNKVNSPNVAHSFRERFRDTFGPSDAQPDVPDVVIPEFTMGDDELIADAECVDALRSAALHLSADAGPEKSVEMFRQEGQGLIEGAERLQLRVKAIQDTLEDLQRKNRFRLDEAKQRLEQRLSTGLDPEVRNEVYQRVLRRLEKIDLLRYPRKLLSLPIRGLKTLLTGWLPGKEKDTAPIDADPNDPVTSETFHLLESELIRLADDARLDIQGQQGFEKLLDRDTFQSLRLDHEEVKRQFEEHYESFSSWLAQHARETASQITGENKAKFIISQVLFNTLLITAQVHTGGAFSLLELGMDGVLSPFVAKAVGMAIGNDKVKEFEEQAHEVHQKSLGEILERASQRIDDFLENASAGIDQLSQRLNDIVDCREPMTALIDDFGKQTHGDSMSGGQS